MYGSDNSLSRGVLHFIKVIWKFCTFSSQQKIVTTKLQAKYKLRCKLCGREIFINHENYETVPSSPILCCKSWVGTCCTIAYYIHFRLRIRRNFLIMHGLEKLSYEFHELITVQILNFEGELSYYVTGSTIHWCKDKILLIFSTRLVLDS